jgi:hypothetical protein
VSLALKAQPIDLERLNTAVGLIDHRLLRGGESGCLRDWDEKHRQSQH